MAKSSLCQRGKKTPKPNFFDDFWDDCQSTVEAMLSVFLSSSPFHDWQAVDKVFSQSWDRVSHSILVLACQCCRFDRIPGLHTPDKSGPTPRPCHLDSLPACLEPWCQGQGRHPNFCLAASEHVLDAHAKKFGCPHFCETSRTQVWAPKLFLICILERPAKHRPKQVWVPKSLGAHLFGCLPPD